MGMKLVSAEQVVAERAAWDPEFRAELERTAVASAISVAVVKYRGDHGLSQRKLAVMLGMSQPQVARLETGEHSPSLETIQRLATKLGWRLMLALAPAGHEGDLCASEGLDVFADVTYQNASRLVLAASWPSGQMSDGPAARGPQKRAASGGRVTP